MGLPPEDRTGLERGQHLMFSEYVKLVQSRPEVADLSHRRIARMLGDLTGDHLFTGQLFGLEEVLREIRDFFHAAGQGLELRRRILLLMGPVGGGKSTVVEILKRGLEAFSRTPEGALYAIEGCPLQEEPLHLVPHADRPRVMAELGVEIEGDLCPYCALRLSSEFAGDASRVPVVRCHIDERLRHGIGTFTPSDPKSQDIAELTGSLDFSAVSVYGSESDPRAFRFDGELDVASRGLMEFVELLKCDERFLYTLLTLAQEGRFKTGRYAMMYADEAVIAHTNEAEYRAFAQNPRNEALRDRVLMVRVPYNLRLAEETRIYRRLLAKGHAHIAPHTVEAAAVFAILTRLEDSTRGVGRLQKLHIYDAGGDEALDLHAESPDEGMRGISPRYVLNRLGLALAQPGRECLGPVAALRSLEAGLRLHPAIPPEEVEGYRNLLHIVGEQYDAEVEAEVFPLFAMAFGTQADDIFQGYLTAIERYLESTGHDDRSPSRDPDEAMMRAIEEGAGIAEAQKRSFREEIHLRSAALGRRGLGFDYTGHPALRRAVERRLFGEVRGFVQRAASARERDPRLDAVREELIAIHGYCPDCASGVLQYVSALPPR